MDKLLTLFVVLTILGILWALPLYICVNFVLWLFRIHAHLTLLQSFGLCWLASIIHSLLFKNKEG